MKAPVRPGEILDGKYRIERQLGVGGMGVVVQAHHLKLDQRVAIKFLLPQMKDKPDVVARFSREARAAVRIKSDHVARVLDVSNLDDGSPYMVMEFLEGQDLRQILRAHGPFPIEPLADYILQALEALAEAHRAGVVHRDLKPANLFLTSGTDSPPTIKVLDFGISKLAADAVEQDVTSSVAMLGSPVYMSPEQVRLSRAVDHRADIWSVGALMYELVTGARPFPRDAIAQTVSAILFDAVEPPSKIRPGLPPAFEAAILRCLQKEPANRFADCGELATALAPFASPEVRAIVPRIRRWTIGASKASLPAPEVEALVTSADPGTGDPVQSTQGGAPVSNVPRSNTTGMAVASGVGFAFGAVVLVVIGYAYLSPVRRLSAGNGGVATSSAQNAAPSPSASSSSGGAASPAGTAPLAKPSPVTPSDGLGDWKTVEPPPSVTSPLSVAAISMPPSVPPKSAASAQPRPSANRPKPPAGTVSGFGARD